MYRYIVGMSIQLQCKYIQDISKNFEFGKGSRDRNKKYENK